MNNKIRRGGSCMHSGLSGNSLQYVFFACIATHENFPEKRLLHLGIAHKSAHVMGEGYTKVKRTRLSSDMKDACGLVT